LPLALVKACGVLGWAALPRLQPRHSWQRCGVDSCRRGQSDDNLVKGFHRA